jgi:solute carrier family 26 (sodium-independent sulfate anion transporter), member 11
MPTREQFRNGLARALGIQLDESDESSSESEPLLSDQSPDTFVESAPTAGEWLAHSVPTLDHVNSYISSLFPFLNWIRFYNLQWLVGDLVAGMTIRHVGVTAELSRDNADLS